MVQVETMLKRIEMILDRCDTTSQTHLQKKTLGNRNRLEISCLDISDMENRRLDISDFEIRHFDIVLNLKHVT